MTNIKAITPIKGLISLFEFTLNSSSGLTGLVDTSAPVIFAWGDGTSSTYNGTGQSFSHTYAGSGTYSVKVLGYSRDIITKFWQYTGRVDFPLSALPSSVTNLFINNGNVSGSVGDFSANINTIEIRDLNSITGDIATAPNGITTLYITGNNTISGDIADMPTSCSYFYIIGNNTLTGNISGINSGLYFLLVNGNNTISGDISTIPANNLTTIWLDGANTITGDISTLPALASLTTLVFDGQNTVYGDFANLPANVSYVVINGQSTVSDYTAGRAWAANLRAISINPTSGGLSSTEVDDLLIELSAQTFINEKIVSIAGTNAARTAASDAAVTSLQGQGVTVTTN